MVTLQKLKPVARLTDYTVRMFELPPANAPHDATPRELKSTSVRARNRDHAHRQAEAAIRAMKREARVIQNQGGGGNVLMVYLWHPSSSHPDTRRLQRIRAPRGTTLTPAQLRRSR